VQNSAGSNLINVDTTNSNVTILGNNDGQLAAWSTNTNALPAVRSSLNTVVANGYVYAIGGGNGSFTAQSTVYYAKLNANGSAGSWSTNANALPSARYQATSVVANGYVYVMGGRDASSVAQSTVYYAKLKSDGSTSTWSTNGNALPQVLYSASSAVANGYVYVLGGSNASVQSTVYYAKLNADGSTGTWTTNTNALSAVRVAQTTVVANGYIYAIGGQDSSTGQTTVYYAKLNNDGSIGSWSTTTALATARYNAASVVSNGYVYVIGGYSAPGSTQATVLYAKLNSDGTIGSWNTNTNALPTLRGELSATIANGYVYALGGYDGSSVVSTVYYASTSRIQVGGSLDLIGLQGQSLADPGDSSTGSTGGSITAGNITAVGTLQVQGQGTFAQGISVGGNITVGGSALFQNSANSTVAFQVQDAGGVSLLAVDTTNRIITVSGDATTFASLTITNAHFKSTQTTAPTIGTPANCGTSPTAAVTAASTDSAGSFTVTTGTGALGAGTCDTIFTFNKTYGAAPKSIIVTAGGQTAAAKAVYVSASSATTFTIKFNTPATVNSEGNTFYYWVIE
jgi:N-acetylneuraminic acid mutarotase